MSCFTRRRLLFHCRQASYWQTWQITIPILLLVYKVEPDLSRSFIQRSNAFTGPLTSRKIGSIFLVINATANVLNGSGTQYCTRQRIDSKYQKLLFGFLEAHKWQMSMKLRCYWEGQGIMDIFFFIGSTFLHKCQTVLTTLLTGQIT